jgi:hypothetical protein
MTHVFSCGVGICQCAKATGKSRSGAFIWRTAARTRLRALLVRRRLAGPRGGPGTMIGREHAFLRRDQLMDDRRRPSALKQVPILAHLAEPTLELQHIVSASRRPLP